MRRLGLRLSKLSLDGVFYMYIFLVGRFIGVQLRRFLYEHFEMTRSSSVVCGSYEDLLLQLLNLDFYNMSWLISYSSIKFLVTKRVCQLGESPT
jgi:hypothetical protein